MTVAKRACHGAVREGDHNFVLNFVPTCDHIMCARNEGGARLTHDMTHETRIQTHTYTGTRDTDTRQRRQPGSGSSIRGVI